MLEFGARSTGEPASLRDVACDASGLIEGVVFPTARPRVMHAERTFWEKATAIHVFCLQERLRGDRFARHWHDVVRLDEAGFAEAAFADRDLAKPLRDTRACSSPRGRPTAAPIDYAAAVNGGLRLVPAGDGPKALEEDYARMVEDGLLLEDAEPFAGAHGAMRRHRRAGQSREAHKKTGRRAYAEPGIGVAEVGAAYSRAGHGDEQPVQRSERVGRLS